LLGRFRAIGALFFPHTLGSFFGFDASGLTDTCLDVGLLSAPPAGTLAQCLIGGEQIDILASWLSGLVRKTDLPPDAVTGFALRRIMATGGQFSLPQLQQDLRLSERSLERRFNQHVGIPPKLFARVCQFQAALHNLKATGTPGFPMWLLTTATPTSPTSSGPSGRLLEWLLTNGKNKLTR
jgi:AraC-like DNA-binding protein